MSRNEIPFSALDRRELPTFLGDQQRELTLQNMRRQGRVQEGQLAEQERKQQEGAVIRKVLSAGLGDDETVAALRQAGVPEAAMEYENHVLDKKKTLASMDDIALKKNAADAAKRVQRAQALLAAPQERWPEIASQIGYEGQLDPELVKASMHQDMSTQEYTARLTAERMQQEEQRQQIEAQQPKPFGQPVTSGGMQQQNFTQFRPGIGTVFGRQDLGPAEKPTPTAQPTADIQNYNFYAEQMKAAGKTPKPFNDWLTEDANRRRSVTNVAAAPQPTTGMDPAVSDALRRATLKSTPANRSAAFSAVNAMYARGDVAQARETVRQVALEGEPVATRQQVYGRREVMQSLGSIRNLLKQVPTNLLVGTVEDTARKLGQTSNPTYVKLGTQLLLAQQSYRRTMTGAAFSAPESAEYERLFPGYKNSAPVNDALIGSLIDAFGARDALYWNNKLGPGWADTPPPSSGGGGGGQPGWVIGPDKKDHYVSDVDKAIATVPGTRRK